MAKRCPRWRPINPPGHSPAHDEPGECRRCGKPCHNVLPDSQTYCDACRTAYLEHRLPAVRLLLASDVQASEEDLRSLANDLDMAVSMAARDQLETRGVSYGFDPTQVILLEDYDDEPSAPTILIEDEEEDDDFGKDLW